jgi:proteasome lid subunit RPN8/RPN11
MDMVEFPSLPKDLSPILSHLEAAYPREGCALIFEEKDGGFTQESMENVYDKYHRLDPIRFPRDSKTAYKLDELKVHRLIESGESRGARLAVIVHSHCDVGAYFSAEDRQVAAPDGTPLWPGVSYLVVAVDGGRATGARMYAWTGGDFGEALVPLVAPNA